MGREKGEAVGWVEGVVGGLMGAGMRAGVMSCGSGGRVVCGGVELKVVKEYHTSVSSCPRSGPGIVSVELNKRLLRFPVSSGQARAGTQRDRLQPSVV